MDDKTHAIHREQSRRAQNQEFVRRLLTRRPYLKGRYDQRLKEFAARDTAQIVSEAAVMSEGAAEALGMPALTVAELVAETIVSEERPVLFVRNDWLDLANVTKKGLEAEELVKDLESKRASIEPIMPLIGRIDAVEFPSPGYVGTGWFVDADIVVTNRHVAELIAQWNGRNYLFRRGVAGRPLSCSLSTLHEFDDLALDAARNFAVKEVLYIEPRSGPHDIAFLRVERRTDGAKRDRIAIANLDANDNAPVVAIGYPARASRRVIPDQELMKELYRDRYDVKRAAPGYSMGTRNGISRHDCTTLGGNSGSAVLDMRTGEAIGLHFAGLYHEENRAVPASVLRDYVNKKRWTNPQNIETTRPDRRAPPPPPGHPPRSRKSSDVAGIPAGAVTVTIPLSITVSLGQPTSGSPAKIDATTPRPDAVDVETAVKDFWDQRPQGVIAARVGFTGADETIGDTPCIAASVSVEQLAAVAAAGPRQFAGFEVMYLPANATEQIDARPEFEASDRIAYDDDARTGKNFSLDPIEEEMTVRLHVGPEYSWDELNAFLSKASGTLVSAIYEFHAPQIKDAIEARLNSGTGLKLVMDNATFAKIKDENEEFDRFEVFERWGSKFGSKFQRVVAPEGNQGLISDSYHIKVTVREDDTFWLSSGNWKKGSSQPVITQQQRDDAAETDLPGNREWHVVISNKTLSTRFKSHILQDLERSTELGGGPVPHSAEATDEFVDVPIEEAVELERVRPPPGRVIEPRQLTGKIKVRPLLTPDREGAIYSESVLALIRSARKSLLFQIPYIGMPSNPQTDRGFIDELITALTDKLKTLDDARVILRVGGKKFSAPTHAAWFFKSKGVDIDERLREIENHHTKGMIVDGKKVLLGSHNWSKSGVALNRDASLLFEDARIAGYYAEAFEIDWARSSPIRPRRFVKPEAVMREAVGDQPPPGFRRVLLKDLLKEDD
jgi:hypothetical protein